MRTPLTIYTVLPQRSGASAYYRVRVPMETARDLGLNVRFIVDENMATVPAETRVQSFCESDIITLYQPIGEGPINNIRSLASFIPSKRDGGWKWPPSVVVETDDNLLNVSPLNQAFKNLGIRDMDGGLIPLGHSIGVSENGERRVLWRDGEDGFSLARNRQAIASWRSILQSADAVSCSTPGVEQEIRKEVTPRRSRVFPNLVRLDHYPQVALAEEPGTIKILWQGGSAHYEDWHPLREALGRITAKYPQVHWVIWGMLFSWATELIPAHRYTYVNWCDYSEYKLRLCMVGHDISLAPLTDNVFNRCRSGIKFYEASVLKKPAATLAQNTASYRDEVIDGETALLFKTPEEFEAKLSLLIEDAAERQRLAANAKDWVSENRDAMKKVPEMVQWWEEIRAERPIEQPHVTDEEFAEIEAQELQEAQQSEADAEPVPA